MAKNADVRNSDNSWVIAGSEVGGNVCGAGWGGAGVLVPALAAQGSASRVLPRFGAATGVCRGNSCMICPPFPQGLPVETVGPEEGELPQAAAEELVGDTLEVEDEAQDTLPGM